MAALFKSRPLSLVPSHFSHVVVFTSGSDSNMSPGPSCCDLSILCLEKLNKLNYIKFAISPEFNFNYVL